MTNLDDYAIVLNSENADLWAVLAEVSSQSSPFRAVLEQITRFCGGQCPMQVSEVEEICYAERAEKRSGENDYII